MTRRSWDDYNVMMFGWLVSRRVNQNGQASGFLNREQSSTSQKLLILPEEYGDRIDLLNPVASARQATITILGDCKERLAYTSSQLNVHLTDILRRLENFQGQNSAYPNSKEQRTK